MPTIATTAPQTFQRVVKRGGVKLEVWSKGGFFRFDTNTNTTNEIHMQV